MATSFDDALVQCLTAELPLGFCFKIHHVSSPATRCEAIFHPAPGEAPEETFCESHFLSVSIDVNETIIQAFALEVLIYTTTTLTTIFVSKADSTGYLHLLNLPRGTASPIKTVISIFLKLLVENKQRTDVRLVLSLFARAQDQYLFPGSIENSEKHVLDDRGLIRWWCQILESVLLAFPTSELSPKDADKPHLDEEPRSAHGYLRVPGCDVYETKAFFPSSAKCSSSKAARWLPSDPLRALGKAPNVPERCLIPRFPDDPKARFVIDLDDELPEQGSQVEQSPSKPRRPGKWRSVRSLEEFWEMMAFRQECAAGRLVGFIWGVFTAAKLVDRPYSAFEDFAEKHDKPLDDAPLPTPLASQIHQDPLVLPPSPVRTSGPLRNLPPSSLPPSQPQPADSPRPAPSSLVAEPSEVTIGPSIKNCTTFTTTDHPLAISIPQPSYARIVSFLEQLDYASISVATDSTLQWIATTSKEAGVERWGTDVTGTKETIPPVAVANWTKDVATSILGPGLVRRKKRQGEGPVGSLNGATAADQVKTLDAGLVRKKAKLQT